MEDINVTDIKESKIYVVPKNLDNVIEKISNRIDVSKQETFKNSVVVFDFITKHLAEGWECKLLKPGETSKEIKFVMKGSKDDCTSKINEETK